MELFGFPDFTIYDNGIIEIGAAHNQGSSNMWPYTMFVYDSNSDSYIKSVSAYDYDKSFGVSEEIYGRFPEEYDLDGDRIVYYVDDDVMDGADYDNWHSSVTGNELSISYYHLNQANISGYGMSAVEKVVYVAQNAADAEAALMDDNISELDKYMIASLLYQLWDDEKMRSGVN